MNAKWPHHLNKQKSINELLAKNLDLYLMAEARSMEIHGFLDRVREFHEYKK
jgi:hypothetical protein